MKLKSFKIQNYRSCKSTVVPINEGLTCLIGVNGSGKTNILNAILLLRGISQYEKQLYFQNERNNKCKVDIELIHLNKNMPISGDIYFDSNEYNMDIIQDYNFKLNYKNFINYSEEVEVTNNSLNNGIKTFSHIVSYFNNNFQFKSNTTDAFDDDNLIRQFIKINQFVGDFFKDINYYSASIFSNPSKCPSNIEFDEKRPKFKLRNDKEHEQFIVDLYSLSKKEGPDYKSYLNLVNKSGMGLIDNIIFTEVPLPSQSYEVITSENIKVNGSKRLLVVPNFQIDGYNLSPNQLSEGTFRTLALIFYILNDDSKLLLIEEPEVCVHHGLLSSIIELIKSQSKHKQIIISTHSDFVLDQLEPENIVLVKRDDKKGTTTKSLTKSMSKNDYKALRNYLNETGNLGEYWKEGGFDNE